MNTDKEHPPRTGTDDTCHGRCAELLDWFAWECRGLMAPEESHEVLDMLLNRLAAAGLDQVWNALQ